MGKKYSGLSCVFCMNRSTPKCETCIRFITYEDNFVPSEEYKEIKKETQIKISNHIIEKILSQQDE